MVCDSRQQQSSYTQWMEQNVPTAMDNIISNWRYKDWNYFNNFVRIIDIEKLELQIQSHNRDDKLVWWFNLSNISNTSKRSYSTSKLRDNHRWFYRHLETERRSDGVLDNQPTNGTCCHLDKNSSGDVTFRWFSALLHRLLKAECPFEEVCVSIAQDRWNASKFPWSWMVPHIRPDKQILDGGTDWRSQKEVSFCFLWGVNQFQDYELQLVQCSGNVQAVNGTNIGRFTLHTCLL